MGHGQDHVLGSLIPTRAAFCKRYAQFNVCASQIVYHRVDLHTVKQRVLITFGGLALAVILVGVAFGALGRKATPEVRVDGRTPPAAPPPAGPPPQSAPPTDWPGSG
jgi:hypothetical protein